MNDIVVVVRSCVTIGARELCGSLDPNDEAADARARQEKEKA